MGDEKVYVTEKIYEHGEDSLHFQVTMVKYK